MFVVDQDGTIHLTRGDTAFLDISAKTEEGVQHLFTVGDIIQLKVFGKKQPDNVYLTKRVEVTEAVTVVFMTLTGEETKFGPLISKPTDYWYEIEMNPEIQPITLVGYNKNDGPKIFKLYPEGGD